MALGNNGVANVKQSGLVGGGQIGYDFQFATSLLIGLEADFQGSAIFGRDAYSGVAHDRSVAFWRDFQLLNDRTATGAGQVSAGLDWLGTVRGRFGYLVTPSLLIYATGGLAYGGARASALHSLSIGEHMVQGPASSPGNLCANGCNYVYPTTAAAGWRSGLRAGWTVGGGAEWKFSQNWSVRAEALYFNLGSAAFTSTPIAGFDCPLLPYDATLGGWSPRPGTLMIVNVPTTRVAYQGIIARAGVNYHFNWFAPFP